MLIIQIIIGILLTGFTILLILKSIDWALSPGYQESKAIDQIVKESPGEYSKFDITLAKFLVFRWEFFLLVWLIFFHYLDSK